MDYFAPRTFFSFGPNSVLEGDVYLVVGDYKHARRVIYDLHNTLPARDLFTPIGFVDSLWPQGDTFNVVQHARTIRPRLPELLPRQFLVRQDNPEARLPWASPPSLRWLPWDGDFTVSV